MNALKGFQKRYLKGLAHDRKPLVFVGQKGITPTLIKAMDAVLNDHELVKVRFVDFKEKEKKRAMVAQIEGRLSCESVALVGHVATFYRRQADAEKRKIIVPQR